MSRPPGPAVFLDRDGVINRATIRNGAPHPPAGPDELEIPSDVPAALDRLKAAGLALVVVTNQPDVARGRQTRAIVEALNLTLASRLPLDEVRVCYHDDADDCGCRKPKPGLLLQAPAYDVAQSFMVGDRWRDIEAGQRAGVRATILMDSGHTEPVRSEPGFRAASLSEAAEWILQKLRS